MVSDRYADTTTITTTIIREALKAVIQEVELSLTYSSSVSLPTLLLASIALVEGLYYFKRMMGS